MSEHRVLVVRARRAADGRCRAGALACVVSLFHGTTGAVHPEAQVRFEHRRNLLDMKAQNDLSLWSIIERLQRRLERQGMPPATADRALSLALRQLAMSPTK